MMVLAGQLYCLVCRKPVNFKTTQKVKAHCASAVHKKNLETARKEGVQGTLADAFDRKKRAKEDASSVIMDKELEAFRGRVLATCFKAGIDKEKVAKISNLLSTPKHAMPASASTLNDYIPYIQSALRSDAKARIGTR